MGTDPKRERNQKQHISNRMNNAAMHMELKCISTNRKVLRKTEAHNIFRIALEIANK